jgi:glycine hydroxymethyltransferase
VQEMTRFGMNEKEMKVIAEFFNDVLNENISTVKMKNDVIDFRKNFQKVKYCFSD